MIGGSFNSARAIETRWRSPPESERPRSPTMVFEPVALAPDEFGGLRQFERRSRSRLRSLRAADAKIFLDRAGEQHRLLKDDADIAPERLQRHVADVDPVDHDLALRRIEDAMQQAERRRFARARRADKRDRLAGRDLERDIAHRLAPAVIGKAHMIEGDAPLEPAGIDGEGVVGDLWRGVENLEKILQLRRLQEEAVDEADDLLQPRDQHGGQIHEGDDLADAGEAFEIEPGAEQEDREQGQRGGCARRRRRRSPTRTAQAFARRARPA